MAETLPHGPVVPNRTDRISKSGVDEIRTLGASVSGGLGTALSLASTVDAESKSRDAALADQIAGMEGMTYVGAWEPGTSYRINDVVTHGGDSWARLTAGSGGEPGVDAGAWGLVARKGDGGGFGELSETDVTGLYDTVPPADTTPDTGTLTVTATFTEVTRGSVYIRRVGKVVHVTLYDVEFANSTPPEFFYPDGLLPVGYRPAALTSFPALADVNGTVTRRIRFQPDGQILLYAITAQSRINVTVSYLTPDAWPV